MDISHSGCKSGRTKGKGCHPAPSRLAHGGAGHAGTAQLPSHCRKECTALTTEFSSRRLGLMRSSWEPLPHPHGASGLVSRKGSPHPAAALLWPRGGGHTPGSRGPQPGGADCPHPYTRGPAAGHLTPQLWTEPPSMQGRERPHTRALHPLEALQDPTSDPALANAPVQGHQGQLTPLSGTPARRPSWGSPPPQLLSSVLSATQGLQGYWLADQYRVPPPPSKPGSLP